MKSLMLTFVALLISQSAFSETAEFKIKGMTCEGCVDAIKGKVCDAKDLGLVKCEVEVGKLNVTTAPGVKIDSKKVEALVDKAGYEVVADKKAKPK